MVYDSSKRTEQRPMTPTTVTSSFSLSVSMSSSASSSSSSAAKLKSVDATPLMLAIQMGEWDNIQEFLSKGQWSNPELFLTEGQCRTAQETSPHVQVRTWMDIVNMQLLPLHGAILYCAPLHIIEALVNLYPAGCEKQDQNGNLPLHLAFLAENSQEVIAKLMCSNPDGIFTTNNLGYQPLDLVGLDEDPENAYSLGKYVQAAESIFKTDQARLQNKIKDERSSRAMVQRDLRKLQIELRMEKEKYFLHESTSEQTPLTIVEHIAEQMRDNFVSVFEFLF